MKHHPDAIRELIRKGYGDIATSGASCCSSTPTCCGSSPEAAGRLAQDIGYSAAELASLPPGANMGLSCGNPNALAALRPGEVVLDLGAGGGFDVFKEAGKLGIPAVDLAAAVTIAAQVKDAPHQAVLRLADSLAGRGPASSPTSAASCCSPADGPGGCC